MSEQIIITTSPMLAGAREYLNQKGCEIVSIKTPEGKRDQVKFPDGCRRSDEIWPRVSYVTYQINFPDNSYIIEQQAAVESILSLPLEDKKA